MADEVVNVNEFEEIARRVLPKAFYDFVAGGAEDKHTLKENVEAFRRMTIRPRVLVDVSRINMSTTILGYNVSSPLMLAPTSRHQLAHPEGEVATARAAAASKVIMGTESNVKAFTDETFDASLNWKDISWLRSITRLPILVKGILAAEDAIKALEVGIDGIIVSNHGARQLDYSPATISVLEEIVHAVKGEVPVFMDGGVRRGTDIFKALALGAQAVVIGRPVIYGLAARGEGGVRMVIEMLKNAVKDITRHYVMTERDRLQSKI
ncbi:hypothetical protein MLD38_029515 [Melastoma candidum]|uniref:Uncharacterized protein n=1 Tax=Melastoma candidum TaxID=119954 RepID=A0ACB9N638_9MYRT|nr:hypothetical protein MLD38_029515 [Melastoma candidum]